MMASGVVKALFSCNEYAIPSSNLIKLAAKLVFERRRCSFNAVIIWIDPYQVLSLNVHEMMEECISRIHEKRLSFSYK